MGFGDKLKGLREQAQQAVAENRDKIQDAVQVVGEAANVKTHGKYAAKIAKVGAKVEQSVERVAESGAAPGEDPATTPVVHDPPPSVTSAPADGATSGFPEFD
ncbi:MAG TPA: antitoxin [Solirubrobacteraceae bacterium]|nr:antitoxin [Solirubrobacteraceae bacterium]